MNQEKTMEIVKSKMAATKPADPASTIQEWMNRNRNELIKALPNNISPDALSRQILTTIRNNPKLLECNVASLYAAIIQTAQLGLEPNNLGHAYFVPFYDKKSNSQKVQFIIGYTGYLELINRTGKVSAVQVQEVYENDYFKYWANAKEGKQFEWEPYYQRGKDDPGKLIGVFMFCETAIAPFSDFMPMSEINKHRKAAKTSYIWDVHEVEMARKTIIRKNWRYLPVSRELQKALAYDETIKSRIDEDMETVEDEYMDVDYQVVEEGN